MPQPSISTSRQANCSASMQNSAADHGNMFIKGEDDDLDMKEQGYGIRFYRRSV